MDNTRRSFLRAAGLGGAACVAAATAASSTPDDNSGLLALFAKRQSVRHYDGPMAAGYLCLAARALGYGTVFVTDSIPEQVTREVLSIPERYQRVCITPLGVPDGWPEPTPKRKLEELVVFESFG